MYIGGGSEERQNLMAEMLNGHASVVPEQAGLAPGPWHYIRATCRARLW
jgi:hypothetical protein